MTYPTTMTSVPLGGRALALLYALEHSKAQCVCYVAEDASSMRELAAACRFFMADWEQLHFPAWDCVPYDRVSPQKAIMQQRIKTLIALSEGTKAKRLLLTTVHALMQKVVPADVMKDGRFLLNRGEDSPRSELSNYLEHHGYQRVSTASDAGDYAVRGSIVDIVTLSDDGLPVGYRLDFFGDEIEHIRQYSPLTQMTEEGDGLSSLTLYPMSEVLVSDETIAKFRHRYRQQFGAVMGDDPLYTALSEQRAYAGAEHWLPFFYPNLETLFDYFPEDTPIFMDEGVQNRFDERSRRIAEYYTQRKAALESKVSFDTTVYKPLRPDQLWLTEADWQEKKRGHHWTLMTPFDVSSSEENLESGLKPTAVIAKESTLHHQTVIDALISWLETQNPNWRALIACMSEGSLERISHMFELRGFSCHIVHSYPEALKLPAHSFGLVLLPISTGCVSADLAILSEQDLFGKRMRKSSSRKTKASELLQEASNYNVGDIVVHRDHGLGRFQGLETITAMGHPHDCLCIIYDGDDKLYLPVENIDLVTRYGNDQDVKLDKLGGLAWQSRKASLKERIKYIAHQLLATAAKRLMHDVDPILVDSDSYDEFCARFPYVETEDQLKASEDIQEDLASGKIMDRLICGDVGFGKTEIAMRAAFMMLFAKERQQQVAVVVPTTLLARQHYASFKERFAHTAVKIGHISRFVSKKEMEETKRAMREGRVDIVIGTHALLADTIAFKNLGLVIIDEEQHFGVSQKEKLKQMKEQVHMLALSATPIPRTLHMSISGMRGLSLLATPPVDRLAIRSFVMPYDHVVIREALLREHQRGGQSFYVVPRIKDLDEVYQRLQETVPELKIVQAHGRMKAAQLDKIMTDFYEGAYDLLLSTTIVESGLDVPRANTIVIHRADQFGLSQLYQLRGRVGRSHIRAYAYFTVPSKVELHRTAEKRLEAMQALDSLGAGFQLASHDMDIRGFGNLMGEEQSGQIKEVGVELYQQMLKETLDEISLNSSDAVSAADDVVPQVNLGISVMIPADYVDDISLRMSFYRRIASVSNENELEALASEMIDRFGSLPEATDHLFQTIRIKLIAKTIGIKKIDIGPKGALLAFAEGHPRNPETLLCYVQSHSKVMRLRPDQRLTILWKDPTETPLPERHIPELIARLSDMV